LIRKTTKCFPEMTQEPSLSAEVLQDISVMIHDNYIEPNSVQIHLGSNASNEPNKADTFLSAVITDEKTREQAFTNMNVPVFLSLLFYSTTRGDFQQSTVPVVCHDVVFKQFVQDFLRVEQTSITYDKLMEMTFRMGSKNYVLTLESQMTSGSDVDTRLSLFGVMEALYKGVKKNEAIITRPRSGAITTPPDQQPISVGGSNVPVQAQAFPVKASSEKIPMAEAVPITDNFFSERNTEAKQSVVVSSSDYDDSIPIPMIEPMTDSYVVFVSPMIRHWMTATCLYLSKARTKLCLIVSPFLLTDVYNVRSNFNMKTQLERFRQFLLLLVRMSEWMKPELMKNKIFFGDDPQIQTDIVASLKKLTQPGFVVEVRYERFSNTAKFTYNPNAQCFDEPQVFQDTISYFNQVPRLGITLDDLQILLGPILKTNYDKSYLVQYGSCDVEDKNYLYKNVLFRMEKIYKCYSKERQKSLDDCFKNGVMRRIGLSTNSLVHGMIYRNHEYVAFLHPKIIEAIVLKANVDSQFTNPYAPIYNEKSEKDLLKEGMTPEQINGMKKEKLADQPKLKYSSQYDCFINSLNNIPFEHNEMFEIFSLWKTFMSKNIRTMGTYEYGSSSITRQMYRLLKELNLKDAMYEELAWIVKMKEAINEALGSSKTFFETIKLISKKTPQMDSENAEANPPGQEVPVFTKAESVGQPPAESGEKPVIASPPPYEATKIVDEADEADEAESYHYNPPELNDLSSTTSFVQRGGAGGRSQFTDTEVMIMSKLNKFLDLNDVLYDRSQGTFSPYFQKREACIIVIKAIAFYRNKNMSDASVATYSASLKQGQEPFEQTLQEIGLDQEETAMLFDYETTVINPNIDTIIAFFEKNQTQRMSTDASKATMDPVALSMNPSEIGSKEMIQKDYMNKIRVLLYRLIQMLAPMIETDNTDILSRDKMKVVDFNKKSSYLRQMRNYASSTMTNAKFWKAKQFWLGKFFHACCDTMLKERFDVYIARIQGLDEENKKSENKKCVEFFKTLYYNTMLSPHFVCSTLLSNAALMVGMTFITSHFGSAMIPVISALSTQIASMVGFHFTMTSNTLTFGHYCIYTMCLVICRVCSMWSFLNSGDTSDNVADELEAIPRDLSKRKVVGTLVLSEGDFYNFSCKELPNNVFQVVISGDILDFVVLSDKLNINRDDDPFIKITIRPEEYSLFEKLTETATPLTIQDISGQPLQLPGTWKRLPEERASSIGSQISSSISSRFPSMRSQTSTNGSESTSSDPVSDNSSMGVERDSLEIPQDSELTIEEAQEERNEHISKLLEVVNNSGKFPNQYTIEDFNTVKSKEMINLDPNLRPLQSYLNFDINRRDLFTFFLEDKQFQDFIQEKQLIEALDEKIAELEEADRAIMNTNSSSGHQTVSNPLQQILELKPKGPWKHKNVQIGSFQGAYYSDDKKSVNYKFDFREINVPIGQEKNEIKNFTAEMIPQDLINYINKITINGIKYESTDYDKAVGTTEPTSDKAIALRAFLKIQEGIIEKYIKSPRNEMILYYFLRNEVMKNDYKLQELQKRKIKLPSMKSSAGQIMTVMGKSIGFGIGAGKILFQILLSLG